MSREMDYIKKTGYARKPPLHTFVGGIGFILFIYMSDILPYRSDQYLLFSVPVGVFGILSFVWLTREPNLYAKFFFQTSVSALLALFAYRSISYLFPQVSFYIEVLIISTVMLAHTLPMWNSSTAALIRDELLKPKTWVGKIFFRALLVVAPFAVFASLLIAKAGNAIFTASVFGVLSWFLAIGFPFSGQTPSSPWEAKEK